jgi:hypothetical protein
MNETLVDRLARALLYEGYVLYPYRPSVKNAQRWTFGGVYPRAWSEAQAGTDNWSMQTECLLHGTEQTRLQMKVRFLHLLDRKVGELAAPLDELPPEGDPPFRQVPHVQVGDQSFQSWQEAEERAVELNESRLGDLTDHARRAHFAYSGRRTLEALRSDAGKFSAVLVREQQPIEGSVEISARKMDDGLFKLTVRIVNETRLADAGTRDAALMRSLISTHTILGIEAGEFISMTDPPESCKKAAAECRNIGTWPVLVGEAAQCDTLLSSPIILSDYPQLAPESPGDLFDSTEIDEILTLRILTLTDAEKQAAAGVDGRVRDLLARTEALARDQLMSLHGTMRGLRPVPQEQSNG